MKDETSVRAEVHMRASTAVESRIVAGDAVLRTFGLVCIGLGDGRATIFFDNPDDMDRLAAALVATAAEFRASLSGIEGAFSFADVSAAEAERA